MSDSQMALTKSDDEPGNFGEVCTGNLRWALSWGAARPTRASGLHERHRSSTNVRASKRDVAHDHGDTTGAALSQMEPFHTAPYAQPENIQANTDADI
jgi:hypothetical protein